MKNNTFIPEKIKVGFQKRQGTYTGKLAYVIYFDSKGALRKQRSWESWRDSEIDSQEFTNEPTEGFVLNKGVGGVKGSWSSWNVRNEYIRVYDPRDFEFEISVSNLLFILQETSAIKGKGLEGEFVYGWSGTELVLLPVHSKEYIDSKKHTARQSMKIETKDLKEGFSYVLKNGTNVLYLGRHPYNHVSYYDEYVSIKKKHVFLNLDNPNPKPDHYWLSPYLPESGASKIAECTSLAVVPSYPDEFDRFKNSKYNGIITDIKLIKEPMLKDWNSCTVLLKENDQYILAKIVLIRDTYGYYWNHHRNKFEIYKSKPFVPSIKNGVINFPSVSHSGKSISKDKLNNLDLYSLYVLTEKGTQLKVI